MLCYSNGGYCTVVLPTECFSFVADVASCRDQAVLVHPGLGRVWDQLVPKLESLSQGRQKRLLCPDSFGTTENTFSRAVRKYGDAGMIATMSEVYDNEAEGDVGGPGPFAVVGAVLGALLGLSLLLGLVTLVYKR